MPYVFEPMKIVGLPIHGSDDLYPVRRVYCVGRNYAAHAREMGFDPNREPPFFFCKANDAQSIVPIKADEIAEIPYPTATQNYHHEVELVVAIGLGGKNIVVADADKHIFGYAVGLDMTRRDLQTSMKEMGRPWEIAKAFDFSAPIGELHTVADSQNIQAADIVLMVNGTTRQHSNISHLTWCVAETIAKLSELFELKAGDLVFTGTPEGVGAVVKGDVMHAEIDGLSPITVKVV
ncbi:fumarylacetoacetate hydrolase family protein [Stenoxybacter acetivorans]|uniref:fumarylacetoacetate hydrolase family protein n=1 Tax=Stenoxybacter acetivorans TaxID=422441 RepID=UPI000566E551|nr:fumarylacetoacetate hydrolase family protein [Stenoxybacter acetivorans]